ncbi:MarR family winged helix-turn-helix transcriptional regulator [Actinoallomurus sp. CA-142502]|uniref:MarR family winged helix-turn-helix transcriptional regulator n=1 Tax=Actinoallomurus sp. CA-142502 TaxID=3239885 RepID=UPI003D8FEB2E
MPVEPVEVVERAMVRLRRRMTRRTLAGEAQVNDATFGVLDAVEAAEHAGAPIGVSEVATALSVDQPRASKLVAAAVAAGLIRREADQADGRRTLLARTEAGRDLSEQVHDHRRTKFAAAMADWSPADRADFARLLTRFTDAFG